VSNGFEKKKCGAIIFFYIFKVIIKKLTNCCNVMIYDYIYLFILLAYK